MVAQQPAALVVVSELGGRNREFYALGFTVVQSYVYKNGFEGMFWFTNEFYRDAGAVFILDLIRVPMLAPYIFFPYFLVLFLLILYLVFLFIVPVTYGFYLYDVKIVPIKDSQLVSGKTDLVPDTKDDEIWLLGEFGEKYVFFRKVKNNLSSQGIIETYDVKEIKHLNFDIKRASTLKVHMKDYVPETAKAQTMDWIMEDMAQ